MARRRYPQHPGLRARLSQSAQIFKLEQNYRSTKTILAAAGAVIENNRERKPKRLWTDKPTGELVTYYTGMTERDEADYIAREIGKLTAASGSGLRAAPKSSYFTASTRSRG